MGPFEDLSPVFEHALDVARGNRGAARADRGISEMPPERRAEMGGAAEAIKIGEFGDATFGVGGYPRVRRLEPPLLDIGSDPSRGLEGAVQGGPADGSVATDGFDGSPGSVSPRSIWASTLPSTPRSCLENGLLSF